MKKTFLLSLVIFSIVLSYPSQTFAAQTPNCIPIFGGGNSCEQNDPLIINKQAQNPDTDEYVDNLPSDTTYKAGDTVRFKITVSNSGNASLKNVTVKDIFPAYIDYAKGAGKYDQKTRTFSFTIDELKSKENKVYFIEGKVVTEEKLPKEGQSNCVINQAEMSASGKTSRDNARVCVGTPTVKPTTTPTAAPTRPPATKGGTTIYPPKQSKETPKTGPETLALIGLAPLGALGFYLRNKAKA